MTPRIRVLCVDDHRVVREGIALIIGRQTDMEVVGSAASGEEAIVEFRRHLPDITLMDLRLGTMSGLEAIRAIRREHDWARIIVLTIYQGDEDIYKAMAAGAAAYLLKDTLSDELVRVVPGGVRGGRTDRRRGQGAPRRARHPADADAEGDSGPASFISQGNRNKTIASALKISEETVQVHIRTSS